MSIVLLVVLISSCHLKQILSKVFRLFECREKGEHDMKSLNSGFVNRNVKDGAENINIGLKINIEICRW